MNWQEFLQTYPLINLEKNDDHIYYKNSQLFIPISLTNSAYNMCKYDSSEDWKIYWQLEKFKHELSHVIQRNSNKLFEYNLGIPLLNCKTKFPEKTTAQSWLMMECQVTMWQLVCPIKHHHNDYDDRVIIHPYSTYDSIKYSIYKNAFHNKKEHYKFMNKYYTENKNNYTTENWWKKFHKKYTMLESKVNSQIQLCHT